MTTLYIDCMIVWLTLLTSWRGASSRERIPGWSSTSIFWQMDVKIWKRNSLVTTLYIDCMIVYLRLLTTWRGASSRERIPGWSSASIFWQMNVRIWLRNCFDDHNVYWLYDRLAASSHNLTWGQKERERENYLDDHPHLFPDKWTSGYG